MKSIFSMSRKALVALMACAALLISGSAFAQNAALKGKVVDVNGEPIIGAGVVAQNTTNGVITDIDGNFQINVAPKTKLEISCIGYATIVVDAAANMVVTLQEDRLLLEEAVAVGYGTMKKSDVTGSMVSVTAAELTANPVLNAAEALQGKAAGVNVSTANMRPGSTNSITIRGANTTGTRSPLIVIDGVISQNIGLDAINPQDIESIEILKDASATAIYGAQGGAGVVLVTTKRGDNGKITLNYAGSVILDKIHDVTPMMDAPQYIEWRRWGYYYAGLGPRADQPTIANDRALFTAYGADETAWANILKGWGLTWNDWKNGATSTQWDPSKVETTDWTKFTDRIGVTQEHTLSASGGNDKYNAYVSLGYLNQTGTNIGQDYKRYTVRASVDVTPTKWFKLGGALYARYGDQQYGIDASNGISGSIPGSLHAKARNIFSYALPYDEEGNRIIYPGGDTTIPTVVDEVGKAEISNLNYQFQATLYGELNFGGMWKPLEGLTFRSTLAPQFSMSQAYKYLSSECVNRVSQGLDYVSSNASKNISYVIDNVVSYNRTFGEHSVNVTLLQEAMSRLGTTLYSMSGSNVALGFSQKWWGLSSSSVGTLNAPSYNSLSEQQMASYMARLNYSYKNRYILTATLRRDGASQLAPGYKWANFPSLALAWRLDQEPWMAGSSSWLDQLKVRAGWGLAGNQSVGAYTSIDALSSGRAVHEGAGEVNYYLPGTIANKTITWEHTQQINFGVDFSVLKGRLSGVVDVFRNLTYNMLFDVTLPSVSGFTGTKDNLGKVLNRGIDITLNSINISTKDFSWRSTLNLSWNKNKILELQNGREDMLSSNLFIDMPSDMVYTYKGLGLWSDSPEDLAEMELFNKNGHNFQPGMVRVEDVSGPDGVPDHKIDANYDRQFLGNSRYRWNMGFTNTLRWKDLELAIFMYGNFKKYASTGQYQGGREPVIFMDYYNENNKISHGYQRPYFNTAGNDNYNGYAFQSDASFIKVRQISIGYFLPKKFVNSLGLNNVKITAQLKNPFSIYDACPWTDSDLGGTFNKSYVFGLNIGF